MHGAVDYEKNMLIHFALLRVMSGYPLPRTAVDHDQLSNYSAPESIGFGLSSINMYCTI